MALMSRAEGNDGRYDDDNRGMTHDDDDDDDHDHA